MDFSFINKKICNVEDGGGTLHITLPFAKFDSFQIPLVYVVEWLICCPKCDFPL